MPSDNSIASDSISAKLIEVSRVAESLDVILHETQDGLNIFESTMSVATASPAVVERKISSANLSDVRKLQIRLITVITNCFNFRIGIRVLSHRPKMNHS